MVDPRKLMKLVATKNKQYGHTTDNQELFLETLHGVRRSLSRKERRVARAKAREEMFNPHSPEGQDNPLHKAEFEVREITSFVTQKEANGK